MVYFGAKPKINHNTAEQSTGAADNRAEHILKDNSGSGNTHIASHTIASTPMEMLYSPRLFCR